MNVSHKKPRLLQAKGFGIKEIILQTHGWMEVEIEDYEIFPPLWDVDLSLGDLYIKDDGLNFPVEKVFRDIHEDRKWYSYVTHVRLR